MKLSHQFKPAFLMFNCAVVSAFKYKLYTDSLDSYEPIQYVDFQLLPDTGRDKNLNELLYFLLSALSVTHKMF